MPKIREGFKGQRTIIIPSFIIEKIKQNPLGKMLYITDIGFYPTASYHYRERTAEEATENVLIYCVRGKGWYSLGKKRYHVTQNQFFILPEHEAHTYGSLEDDPWSIYWLHFKGDMAAFSARVSTFPPTYLHRATNPWKLNCVYLKRYTTLSTTDSATTISCMLPQASSTSWA